MGKISDFVSRRVIEPLIIVIEAKDAYVLEGLGDMIAGDNSSNANDHYFVALFKFAALGEGESAQRVNEKIKRNYGSSYVPSKSTNWDSMKRRIDSLAHTHLDHDPKKVFDTYLSSSMPQVDLEGLL